MGDKRNNRSARGTGQVCVADWKYRRKLSGGRTAALSHWAAYKLAIILLKHCCFHLKQAISLKGHTSVFQEAALCPSIRRYSGCRTLVKSTPFATIRNHIEYYVNPIQICLQPTLAPMAEHTVFHPFTLYLYRYLWFYGTQQSELVSTKSKLSPHY